MPWWQDPGQLQKKGAGCMHSIAEDTVDILKVYL